LKNQVISKAAFGEKKKQGRCPASKILGNPSSACSHRGAAGDTSVAGGPPETWTLIKPASLPATRRDQLDRVPLPN